MIFSAKSSSLVRNLFVSFNFIYFVSCGELTVSYSPASLRFGSADSLYSSELDDVIALALGYTPENPTWPGLTITSPFKHPSAAIVIKMKTDGVPIKFEGASYELKEDITLTETFSSVSSIIISRAQRPVRCEKINALDFVNDDGNSLTLPNVHSLDENNLIVSQFLKECAVLSQIDDFLSKESSIDGNGQDVFFIFIDSFASLVKEYGADSPQVKEASEILRASLEQAIYRLRSMYKDRVVVFDALVSGAEHVRRVREAAPFGDIKNDTNYNLASVYTDDFPVIFNIVLILSIILIVAVIAVTAAMAMMDPGRDSIIYRMTNPRMKKDQ